MHKIDTREKSGWVSENPFTLTKPGTMRIEPKETIRVLLVDDEEDSYLLTKILLSDSVGRAGCFQLDWVNNYQEAKEALLKNKYQAYLVDYYLGDRTGGELLQEALAGGCFGPIILLTSGAGGDIEENAIKMGAADYIIKGHITPDSLQRSILYTIDRQALEKELVELKERDKSPNGMIIVDQQGIVQYANKSAADFLGVAASTLLEETFKYTYSNQKTYEIDIIDKEGNSGTGETSVVDIVYHDQPAQLISIVAITDHKRLRDQLEASNNLLEKSNQSLEQFAHIASHDFQSPLGNLKTLLGLFDSEEKDPAHNAKVIEAIKMGVGQLEGSFSGLLDILKVYYGYKEEKQELDISQTYWEVEGMIQETIAESGAVINTDFAQNTIRYNKAHFTSILLNLLSNAVKFRCPSRKPTIFLTSRLVNDSVQMTIKDNGLGIDLKKHGNDIFGSFKRFHHDIEGTGIGLHNTRSIIESYGGQIEVQSEEHLGTTFNIQF